MRSSRLIVPSLGQLFPSATLARVLRDSGCAQPAAAAVGYQEPSLVFLAGTATRLTDTAGRRRVPARRRVPIRLRRGTPGDAASPSAPKPIGLRYTAGPRVEAINISTGQPVTIAVYRSAGPS